jgi:hypothetical protein
MMKAELVNSYPKNGTEVFVYKVDVNNCTDAELEEFVDVETARGYYREDEDGTPLFFSPGTYKGDVVRLVRGKVRDSETESLVDGYRVMQLEDFRIKTSIIEKQMGVTPPQRAKRPVKKIAAEDAEF